MRSTIQRFQPELQTLMSEARNALAAARFDLAKVKGELATAAREARSSCLLRVEGPVDLRQASATLALLGWMEGEQLRTEWVRRPVGDIDGDAAWDLLVSWRPVVPQ